jgi:hypothetical protein
LLLSGMWSRVVWCRICRHSRRTCWFHILVETKGSSETSITLCLLDRWWMWHVSLTTSLNFYQTARCHITKDSNLCVRMLNLVTTFQVILIAKCWNTLSRADVWREGFRGSPTVQCRRAAFRRCHLVLLFVTSSQFDCNVSVYCCPILLFFVTTRNSSDVLNDETSLLCVRTFNYTFN